jgi:Right handed beta helix region
MRKTLFLVLLVALAIVSGPVFAQVTVPGTAATLQEAFSTVSPGQTITITTDIEEEIQIVSGLSGITLQGATPGTTIHRTRFIIGGTNWTVRDLTIDGKNMAGVRSASETHRVIFNLSANAVNFSMINTKIVNPAPGFGAGDLSDLVQMAGAGACLKIQTGNSVSIQNCNFENDDDAVASNETCIIIAPDALGVGPIVIEGCTFAAENRGIQINTPQPNITIRNNSFLRAVQTSEYTGSSITYANDFNDMAGAFGPLGTPIRNLVIEGNTFGNGTDTIGNNTLALHGPIDGVYYRNNTVNDDVLDEAVYARAYGKDLTLTDNFCNALSPAGGEFRIGARSTQLAVPDAAFFLSNVVITGNTFLDNDGASAGFGELVGNILFEDNTVTNTSEYGYWNSTQPHSNSIIRNNLFTNCGAAGNVSGGVYIQGDNEVVVSNQFIGCHNGVAIDESNDVMSAFLPDVGYARAAVGNMIAFNYFIDTDNHAIADYGGANPSHGTRIFNNTISRAGAGAMLLSGLEFEVYNNLMFMGSTAIEALGAATFNKRGFNINANNTYVGIAPTATDVTVPLAEVSGIFVGGLLPLTVADHVLVINGAAHDAGSHDGLSNDYRTDIGAWQDVSVDTAVSQNMWELYR